MKITTIGLDLAKRAFQVHGVDARGQVVVRKSLRRAQMLPFFAKLPSCLVGIEACGTSHHWARELMKLGHEVRLMPPSPSLTGVRAAALAGLAITPLPASALIGGLRILGAKEGLPGLPDLEFAIYEKARPDKAPRH